MTQKPARWHDAHDLRERIGLTGRRSSHHARDQALLGRAIQDAFRAITSISRLNPSSITARRCAITIISSVRSRGSTASRPDLRAPPASIWSPRFIAMGATSLPSSWAAFGVATRLPYARIDRRSHPRKPRCSARALIADSDQHDQPVAFAKVRWRRTPPAPTATVDAHLASGSNDPIRPLLVKTITFRTAPCAIGWRWRQCRRWCLSPLLLPAAERRPNGCALHCRLPRRPISRVPKLASAEPIPVPEPDFRRRPKPHRRRRLLRHKASPFC